MSKTRPTGQCPVPGCAKGRNVLPMAPLHVDADENVVDRV